MWPFLFSVLRAINVTVKAPKATTNEFFEKKVKMQKLQRFQRAGRSLQNAAYRKRPLPIVL